MSLLDGRCHIWVENRGVNGAVEVWGAIISHPLTFFLGPNAFWAEPDNDSLLKIYIRMKFLGSLFGERDHQIC